MATAAVIDTDNDGLACAVVYATRIAADMLRGIQRERLEVLHGVIARRVRYEADWDPELQRLRMPWRTLSDATTDCKSSAIFIGSYCAAMGLPTTIRFIDGEGNGQWTHVYILADHVALDPLLPFNTEPHAFKTCDVQV